MAVVVAVAVAVTVAVVAVAILGQSRMHAHSSLARSPTGVSLISPGTWPAISSATLVSVAEGSSVGQSGEKTKSSLATPTKVADEMADQVPGETKDTPVNE